MDPLKERVPREAVVEGAADEDGDEHRREGEEVVAGDVGGPEPAAFFGTYVDVQPPSRLAWTNDEGGEGGSVTTVTFDEQDGKTLVTLRSATGALGAGWTG